MRPAVLSAHHEHEEHENAGRLRQGMRDFLSGSAHGGSLYSPFVRRGACKSITVFYHEEQEGTKAAPDFDPGMKPIALMSGATRRYTALLSPRSARYSGQALQVLRALRGERVL